MHVSFEITTTAKTEPIETPALRCLAEKDARLLKYELFTIFSVRFFLSNLSQA